MLVGYPYARRIAFFSAFVTPRERSLFDTHASAGSISPGVKVGSGTVQRPLDLSMSILRQCCADAIPTNRISERHFIVAFQFWSSATDAALQDGDHLSISASWMPQPANGNQLNGGMDARPQGSAITPDSVVVTGNHPAILESDSKQTVLHS